MAKAAAARSGVARAILNDVREFCQTHANEERARRYARYFTEGYDAYGVDEKDPAWRENLTKWAATLREAGPRALFDAGDLLVATGKYEEASVAILLAGELVEFRDAPAFDRIGRWFEGGIRNWGHTDVLCSTVLSPFLVQGVVPLEALEAWRGSSAKFKRRAVPVSMVKLLASRGDYERMLAIIEPMMLDREKVVQQGLGWFLRESWKRQPKLTERFLMRFRDTAPRVIFQYATEKMDAAGKARFRRRK